MTEYRLKIKIGDHEFEADGPVDAVKSQFEAFKELIANIPHHGSQTTLAPENHNEKTAPPMRLNVDRVFRQDRRVISLTVPPESATDAVLLILYGQRHYRNNENPTGSEIMDGMTQSGYRETRIDRVLAALAAEGGVIVTGAHRGKRYRLTNQGFSRAEGIVRDALTKLP